MQIFSYIQKPTKNQAPRWTSICRLSYFLCTISCCLLHFRSAALALCGSFPLSSLLLLFYKFYSNFSWPCTDMTESTVDAVKHLYITFLVSDTGSRTDANSRAASKWRIYSLQAKNSHASAPPSGLQQLFLLLRAVERTRPHSFCSVTGTCCTAVGSSSTYRCFIEAAHKTPLRVNVKNLTHTLADWKTSSQHKLNHKLQLFSPVWIGRNGRRAQQSE